MNKQEMEAKYDEFIADLMDNENSSGTVNLYKRVVKRFIDEMPSDTEVRKSDVISWKSNIVQVYKPSTVNLFITVINKFISYCETGEIKHLNKSKMEVTHIREQKNFTTENVVSNAETKRLIHYAKKLGYKDMALIIQLFVDTGIRVNELKEFTVENLKDKTQIKIVSKGKVRQITIPDALKKKINAYITENNIESGFVFSAPKHPDRVIPRCTIDKRLKHIAGHARIPLHKAHAHSFRHLFTKNMERAGYPAETIADVLGHSSVETTRRYMRKNNEEMKEIMNTVANKRLNTRKASN